MHRNTLTLSGTDAAHLLGLVKSRMEALSRHPLPHANTTQEADALARLAMRLSAKPSQPCRTYDAARGTLYDDPATHYWVREIIPKLECKDPVDVLHGLTHLHDLFALRADEAAIVPFGR